MTTMNAAVNYSLSASPHSPSNTNPPSLLFLNKSAFRSGKWTAEEEVYSTALIKAFSERCLPAADVEDGMSLRCYLSKKLQCNPKRISKKFEGTNYNGKQLYQEEQDPTTVKMTPQQVKARQMELQYLHERFEESVKALAASEKERRPSVQKKVETGAARKGGKKPAATSASASGGGSGSVRSETLIAPAPATMRGGTRPPPARLAGNSSTVTTSSTSSQIPFAVGAAGVAGVAGAAGVAGVAGVAGAAGAGISNIVADYLRMSTNTTPLCSGAGVGGATYSTSMLDGSGGDSMMDRLSAITAYQKYYRDQLDRLYAERLQEAKAAAASLLNHQQQEQSSMPLLQLGSPLQGPLMTEASTSNSRPTSLLFGSAAAAAFPSYPLSTSPTTSLTSQDQTAALYAHLMEQQQQQQQAERQLKATFLHPRGTTMTTQEQQQSNEVGLLLEAMKRRQLPASLPEGAAGSPMMNALGNFYTFQENTFGNVSANNGTNTGTNNTNNKRPRYF